MASIFYIRAFAWRYPAGSDRDLRRKSFTAVTRGKSTWMSAAAGTRVNNTCSRVIELGARLREIRAESTRSTELISRTGTTAVIGILNDRLIRARYGEDALSLTYIEYTTLCVCVFYLSHAVGSSRNWIPGGRAAWRVAQSRNNDRSEIYREEKSPPAMVRASRENYLSFGLNVTSGESPRAGLRLISQERRQWAFMSMIARGRRIITLHTGSRRRPTAKAPLRGNVYSA